jgi:protein-tyrosine-phosphatase
MAAVPTLAFVCTGNICRSPMAEAIARRELERAPDQVTVISAGLLSAGRRPPAETTKVMQRLGLDVSAHRSRRLEDALEPPPDVILAMAREHARAVIDEAPELFSRTFTLKDLVRRGSGAGPRVTGEDLPAYLARVGNGRSFASLAGATSTDDVADPIGAGLRTYEACAAEIEELVTKALALLWPMTVQGGGDSPVWPPG